MSEVIWYGADRSSWWPAYQEWNRAEQAKRLDARIAALRSAAEVSTGNRQQEGQAAERSEHGGEPIVTQGGDAASIPPEPLSHYLRRVLHLPHRPLPSRPPPPPPPPGGEGEQDRDGDGGVQHGTDPS